MSAWLAVAAAALVAVVCVQLDVYFGRAGKIFVWGDSEVVDRFVKTYIQEEGSGWLRIRYQEGSADRERNVENSREISHGWETEG